MTTPWQHPQFDPIAISLGPVAIHWYGLMYLCAFLAFYGLGRLQMATAMTASRRIGGMCWSIRSGARHG